MLRGEGSDVCESYICTPHKARAGLHQNRSKERIITVRELLELNRYAHDFTAAMWVCGSILMWMLCREVKIQNIVADSLRAIARIARKISFITIPSLFIALGSGGVRAITFKEYEYNGEITRQLIIMLIVKHALFTAFIIWGIVVHVKSFRLDASRGATTE